jgi:hypothetical protein
MMPSLTAPTPTAPAASAQPGQCRCLRAHDSRQLSALHQTGQPCARDRQRIDNFIRPAAVGHIQQQRAGCIAHVHGILAGELPADVVLGQQNVCSLRVDLRLVLLHPHDLRRCEARQRAVARQRDQPLAANARGDVVALGLRPLVVPQDRRAQHRAGSILKHQPVHLPGQADGGDLVARSAAFRQHSADAGRDAVPPVCRILLAPQRFRLADGLRRGVRGDHAPRRVCDERLGASRADVQSQQKHDQIPRMRIFSRIGWPVLYSFGV